MWQLKEREVTEINVWRRAAGKSRMEKILNEIVGQL